MVVDADVFLDSSIRSTITKSKVNIVTSSTLSGGEFDTTTSLAPDEALYAPLEKIGDFIVIKLLSGNKIKFEKSSLTEYNVYEDSDNNTTPTATLLEGVADTFENFKYVTGSVTGEINPPEPPPEPEPEPEPEPVVVAAPPPQPVVKPKPAPVKKSAPPKKSASKVIVDSSIRVHVSLLDSLMTLAGELVLSRNQLLQTISSGDPQSAESVGQRIDLITSELQEAIMLTRMQPIGNVFGKFPRVVRDLSSKLKKNIRPYYCW